MTVQPSPAASMLTRRSALTLLGGVSGLAGLGSATLPRIAAADDFCRNPPARDVPRDLMPGGAYDEFLREQAAQDQFSGNVLLARGGRIVLERSYGMADKAGGVPNSPATLFPLASVTKTMTAAAVMQLAQRGEIAFETTIGAILDGFPSASAAITVHQLLTLLTYTTFNKGAWVLHMLRHVMGDRRFFAALRQYAQANRGGLVTSGTWQAACERAYGRPLDWFFQEWIYGEGRPTLRMKWNADTTSEGARLHGRIDQAQAGRTFVMPVDIEWTAAGRTEHRAVWLRRRSEELTLRTAAPASKVVLDPGGWLLRN